MNMLRYIGIAPFFLLIPGMVAADDGSRSSWTRTFDDGTTIELIGIGEFLSQQTNNWWNAEGHALSAQPYDYILASFLLPQKPQVRREFALRVSMPGTKSLNITLEGAVSRGPLASPQKGGEQPPELLAIAAFFPAGTKSTTLTLSRGRDGHEGTVTFADVPLHPKNDEAPPAPWNRTFADGTAIELIGIGEFQQTNPWWDPTRAPLRQRPCEFIRASFTVPAERPLRREFAFRVSNRDANPASITLECDGTQRGLVSPQKGDEQPADVLAVAVFFPAGTQTTMLVLRRSHDQQTDTVTFANVPLHPKGQRARHSQQRQVQQETDRPQYGIQRIHESRQKDPDWLDLQRRLKSSELRYRSVSVDEDGHCRLSFASTGTPDLTPLGGAKIDSLNLDTTGNVDLEPLRGMQLKRLSIDSSQITDLSPLQGMPLESLSIWVTNVADLTPLADAQLKTLSAASSNVVDLSPLRGQPLKYLDLRSTRVADLTPLQGMSLDSLQLEDTNVTDLRPLQHVPTRMISLTWKDGMDLRHIHGPQLTWLKIQGNGFNDLSPLAGMKLERLYLADTNVTDLTPLQDMPLWELSLRQTPVVDLAPLRDTRLKWLLVSEPGVDVSPLRNAPLETICIPDPKSVINLDVLRSMKTLKRIRPPVSKPLPVEYFWQWFDDRTQVHQPPGDNS